MPAPPSLPRRPWGLWHHPRLLPHLGFWVTAPCSGSELRTEGLDVPAVGLCSKMIYARGAWFSQPPGEQPAFMKCLLYAEPSVMRLETQRREQGAEEEETRLGVENGTRADWGPMAGSQPVTMGQVLPPRSASGGHFHRHTKQDDRSCLPSFF